MAAVSGDEHPNLRRARFDAWARGDLIDQVRRFLLRRTDPTTADDVLAETLLVCWRRFDEVPDEPLPWVYAVARNCLANAERSRRRQHRVAARLAAVDPPPEQVPPPEADAEVHEALARLRAEDAELLRLWAWEQLTPAEIATVLEVTPNAVSIRLHRARQKLREELRKVQGAAGHEQAEGGTHR